MSPARERLASVAVPVVSWGLRLYFRIFHGVRVRGRRHIPRSGPVVVSANHQSHYDGLLAGIYLSCPSYWMITARYCRMPVLGWLLLTLRGIPVGGPEDVGAYRQILAHLKAGHAVGIFPEGGRTADGELMPFRPGAARAALSVGADIVPVSIVGAFEAWPRQRLLPRLFQPIVVEYHAPIRCERVPRTELERRIREVNGELRAVLDRRLEAWRRLRSR